jgi:putative ABC transport system substrate-binding protein
MSADLAGKQLGLLHDMLPGATRFAVLANPANRSVGYASFVTDVMAAASAVGLQVEVLTATTNRDIDVAFSSFAQKRAEALLVSADPLFLNRRVQLATLAVRYTVPTITWNREYAEAGGLMSYGPSIADVNRQVGIYTGRILKGEKPADLPVQRASKFEFVINLQTAKTLGLTVSPGLLAAADEVIE